MSQAAGDRPLADGVAGTGGVSVGAGAPGRVIGVDLGSRRVGVAVSDAGRRMAVPRTTVVVPQDDDEAVVGALVGLVDETGATAVVVGLPLSLDGRRGPAARAALATAERLHRALSPRAVAVETVDERLTTVTAHKQLAAAGRRSRQRRGTVDETAATVLLQAWLDRQAVP